MTEKEDMLRLAVTSAEEAAALLVERYEDMHARGRDLHVRMKGSPLDLVTDVDAAAQQLIIKNIGARFPEHRILAEEAGAENVGDPESAYRWIIDPLDGTTCFVHGKQNFGVMIALEEAGVVQLAAMAMPFRSMMFSGLRGHGVTCNGKPLALRKTKDLSDAVLCSNLIRRARKGADGILRIPTPPCASLENYGSAVEEFAEVLLGHNDGVFFDGIPLWDVAAGCFMVEELGGRSEIRPKDPSDARSGNLVVSTTAPIFDELSRMIFDEGLTRS